jgi:hypothetical protein
LGGGDAAFHGKGNPTLSNILLRNLDQRWKKAAFLEPLGALADG